MGNDALLDHDTISKYAATGALHILSVSGLHVGIVYILLNSLLKHLLKKKKKNGIIRLLLLLAGIWAYSIATGLSTSVIRSANMLSIMVIGETLGKKGFSVNTLAASAVIQCILHPASLLEPGFQLSYLAVLGILTIYSPLKMILQHPNPILAHIASVCSVSLSAQLFTFPLSLYYFQQFPNYFLPANLLIIPISGIVLYSGLAMLLFSGIPLLHEINVIILKYSLMLMNFMVKFFSELPFAITDNIGLSFINMMILYITIASIIFFFLKMNAVFLRLSLLSIALMSGISMLHEYRIQTQCRWEIYHSDKGRIVALINGKTMHLLSTPGLYRSPYLTRKMKRHWNLDGIEKINWVRLDSTDKAPVCIRIFTEINKGANEKVLKSIIGKKKIHEEHADSFVQGNMPLSLVFTDSRTN
jgi:competence protein ComEC